MRWLRIAAAALLGACVARAQVVVPITVTKASGTNVLNGPIVIQPSGTGLQAGVGATVDFTGATLLGFPGGGTVNTFSAGTLSPLFTTSVANPTTAPALTFNASTAAQNAVLVGPVSGGTGAYSFRLLQAADIPSLSYQPLATNLTSLAGLSYASLSFVKMSAAGTFSLDTNTYLTSSTGVSSIAGTANQITASGSTGSVTLALASPLLAPGLIEHTNGGSTTPSSVFAGATTTGLYWANPGIGFTVAATSIGTMTSTGLNGMAVGATTASTGAFTSLSASSGLTVSSGNVGITSGNETITAGNLTISAGTISATDVLTVTSGTTNELSATINNSSTVSSFTGSINAGLFTAAPASTNTQNWTAGAFNSSSLGMAAVVARVGSNSAASGTVTMAAASVAVFAFGSSLTTTNLIGFFNPSGALTSTFGSIYGAYIGAQTGTITNAVGIAVATQTGGGTGNADIIFGTAVTPSLPSGNVGLYQQDAYANTLAGITNFTSGTASTTTGTGSVVVTGGVGISGAVNIGTTLTATGGASSLANTSIAGAAATTALTITQTARTSGVLPYVKYTIPTDTAQTASTESPGIQGVTGTRTWATTGTVALQREIYWPGPTYASASASQTFTDVFNTYWDKPIQGSNAVFTRSHTLGVVDSTSAASSITGAVVIATTLGTTATSVGIGGGNINAGGGITGATVTSTGALTAGATAITGAAATTALTITQTARTSGVLPYIKWTIPTDTAQTASTESPGLQVVTGTRTWATTGTVALQRENFFAGPTYASASASQTFTDTFTLYATPPVAGANAIFTRGHTLGIVDPTSAASAITGGLVVATTLGTAATSVGIGGGNVNAGGTITSGTTITAGSTITTAAGVTNAAGVWNLGALRSSTALVTSTTQVIQIAVGGTLFSLMTCTTNP